MDLNNVPTVEDKIYSLFTDLLSIQHLEKNEIKTIIDNSIKESNMTMDELINQIIDGVDKGVSMEDQFNIVKILLKGRV